MRTIKITCDAKNVKLLVEFFDAKRRLVKFEVLDSTNDIPPAISDFLYAKNPIL